jgi:hypothetical protein
VLLLAKSMSETCKLQARKLPSGVMILLGLMVALGAAILPATPVAAADISGTIVYHPSGSVVGTYVIASTNVATFSPSGNITAGSTIALVFPAGTALANILVSDFTITQAGGGTAAPSGIAVGAGTIIFTVAAGSLSADGLGSVTIATSGSAGADEIRHPTTVTATGAFSVTTSGDTGTINNVIFVAAATGIVTLVSSAVQLIADGGSTATLTATVTDAFGNNVADGTDVLFETDHGALGSSMVTKQTTNGEATATLTSESSTEIVIATVTATANGVSRTTSVFFIPAGGPDVEESDIETVTGNSGTIPAKDSPTGGELNVSGSGMNTTVTIAKYTGNPGGSTSGFQASGNYYDVHLSNTTGVSSLTVQFCPATVSMVIYYWNGTSWVAASNQSYSGGCIAVTITSSTTPSLSDLTGAVFASGTSASAPAPAPAPRVSPTPPRPLNPAQMSLQYLSVNPQQTSAGQAVTVTTNVVNTGDEAGNYSVALKINGQVEQSRVVSVGAQGTQPVKFTVTKSQPGTYTVTIDDQKTSFTVLGASSSGATGSKTGALIALALIGVLIITTLVVLLLRRT